MASGPAEYEFSQPPPGPEATVRRWDRSDATIGTALVLLAISLFLPWFGETVLLRNRALASGTGDGPHAHGYLWLVLVLAIAALTVLVARDVIRRIPGNLPSAGQLLVGATGLALLLTLLGLAFRPAGFSTGPRVVPFGWTGAFPHLVVSVSWSYGGFIAVAAAAAALIAAFTSAGPLQEANRVAPPAPAAGR